ncbi:MAG: ATP-binding protein [Planctomycetota bacterium]
MSVEPPSPEESHHDGAQDPGASPPTSPIPAASDRPKVPTGPDTLRIIRDDPDTAVGRLRARILSGSADYRTWHNLAVALNNRGDVDGAIEVATTATEKAPESTVSHLLLGMLLREAGRLPDALAAFDRVASIDSEFPRLRANRGVVHFFQGEPDRAATELEAAVRQDDRDRISLFNLAVVEVARKRFPAAQACFERLARLEPDRAPYYHQFLVELGRVQMVEETLSQAHRIKNFLGIVGDRLRRFTEEVSPRLESEDAQELDAIREDQERIYSDMVVFLGAIRPRPMKLEKVDLRALVERIVFVATTSGDGVLIRRDYEEELPAIHCDVDMLQEAFLNILLNAIDAVRERADASDPGEVRIAVRSAEILPDRPTFDEESAPDSIHGIQVEFTDNGVGIEPSELDRIFHFGFTTKSLGSGIGLSHTKKIIADHGGTIRVESEAGNGCCFRCVLPVTPRVSENIVNLTIRSQLLLEPHELILAEGGEDLGI